jgi:hypothetical protein
MAANKIIYSGTSTTPVSMNEFFVEAGEEVTLGIYGAGVNDEIQLQHDVSDNWVNTAIFGVNQKLTSTNTLLGIKGKRFYRVVRVGSGTSSLIVEVQR